MYIIGTAGPKVKEKRVLKGIINGGVNILRLNFAHGSRYEFEQFIRKAKEINSNIQIMIDLCGAKIRVSNELRNIYKIYDDEEVYFCGEDEYSRINKDIWSLKVIPLNIKHKTLIEKNYHCISVKDNTMIFEVIGIENNLVKACSVKGGIIRAGKGCNIKEIERKNKFLSENDKKAVLWGINNNVDIISQSFVESGEDIDILKEFLNDNRKQKDISIWGKIETLKGVKNCSNIAEACDVIIIGRGDLIPETSLEEAPIYEETMIKLIKEKKKEIVIATHVLESMQRGVRPSICEVESIYNFIKKGVSGFLLAGETSVGKTPVKTVEFLNNLIINYCNKMYN